MSSCGQYKLHINKKVETFASEEELNAFIEQHFAALKNLVGLDENNMPEVNFSVNLKAKMITETTFAIMDKDISFDEDNHKYSVKGETLMGSSEFIDNYKDPFKNRLVPEFILEKYLKETREDLVEEGNMTTGEIDEFLIRKQHSFDLTREGGSELHKASEIFFKENITVNDEDQARLFMSEHGLNLISPSVMVKYIGYMNKLKDDLINTYGNDITFIPEAKIADVDAGIAGMIDLAVLLPDGSVVTVDYKSASKDVGRWHSAKSLHIGYQQMIYKRILENKNIKVNSVKIAPFHMIDMDIENMMIMDIEDELVRDIENIDGSHSEKNGIVQKNLDVIFPSKHKVSDSTELNTENTIDLLKNVFDYNIENYTYESHIDYIRDNRVSEENGVFNLNFYNFESQEQESKSFNTESELREGIIDYIKMTRKNVLKFPNSFRWMAEHIAKDSRPPDNIGKLNRKAYNLAKAYGKDYTAIQNHELAKLGISAMHNTKSGIIDFILLDPHSGNRIDLGMGNTLLGKFNDNSIKDKHADIMGANTSNIEAMKVISFLNDNTDWIGENKIGNIIVMNPTDELRTISFDNAKDNFKYILDNTDETVNNNTEYNLGSINAVTPTEELGLYLNKLLYSAIDNYEKTEYEKYVSEYRTVQGVGNKNELRDLVNEIVTKIYKRAGDVSKLTPQQLELTKICATTLAEIENLDLSSLKEITTFIKQGSTPGKTGVQFLDGFFSLMERAILISGNKISKISDDHKVTLTKYIRTSGFNEFTSTPAKLYDNLINEDDMTFKDPEDFSNNLTDSQREYLKSYLEMLNNLRYNNDEKSIKKVKIPKGPYYDVPLMRRTRESHIGKGNIKGYLKEYYNDLVHFKNEISSEENEFYSKTKDITEMYNMFKQYEGPNSSNSRKKLFDKMSENPEMKLETNLEMLLLSYSQSKIMEEEGNKVLPLANSFKSLIEWNSKRDVDLKNVDEYIEYTTKYMLFNDPNLSISDRKAKGILGTGRKIASTLNMSFNPVSGIRELVTGTYVNAVRMMAYKNLDHAFDMGDLRYAYGRVLGDAKDAVSLDRISFTEHLNSQFGITMMDTDSIKSMIGSSHAKMSVFKSKYAFAFNIMPDFLHRTVYFIAKMKKDGVIDAYVHNQDGTWSYDESKDSRFNIYLSGNENHADYAKQKGLYNTIRKELIHDGQMTEDDKSIPTPYTIRERNSIKDLSDSVLGNYDKHAKTKFSNTVFGSLIMQYATWMPSVKDRYWLKSGEYKQGQYRQIERLDENGNSVPMFIDSEGNETTENTGEIAYYWDGHMQEGIFQTMAYVYKHVIRGDVKVSNMLNDNPQRKANLIFLGSDMLTLMIAYALAAIFLDDDKFKKDSPTKYAMSKILINSGKDISGINSLMNKAVGGQNLIPSFGTLNQLTTSAFDVVSGERNAFKEILGNIGMTRLASEYVSSTYN